MSRRHEWTAGNDAIANRDLYWWEIEDLYACLIRPEDGETWGRVPWMDDKGIAENTVSSA